MGRLLPTAIILVLVSAVVRAAPPQILMSTDVDAQRIGELQAKLHSSFECHGPEACEEIKKQREADFGQLRSIVEGFVVNQLNPEPRLERVRLCEQVKKLFGTSTESPENSPIVYRCPTSWSTNETAPVIWALVYREWPYYGFGGSRVVIASYVVDRGKARLAGRGGSEMSGYALSAHEIRSPSPNSVLVLIQGVLEWSSGHELPAKATLYRLNSAGVQTIWESGMLPGLRVSVGADQAGFRVEYHDEARHAADYGDPHTTVIDTYVVGPEGVRRASTERP